MGLPVGRVVVDHRRAVSTSLPPRPWRICAPSACPPLAARANKWARRLWWWPQGPSRIAPGGSLWLRAPWTGSRPFGPSPGARWLTVPLLLLLITAACQQRRGPQAANANQAAAAPRPTVGRPQLRHAPDVLYTELAGEPESLDPARCSENLCGEVVTNLFAGLTEQSPDGGAPVGDVAESWQVDDGGRRYTFTLRPTRWSDGAQVTAADFVASWLRVLRPTTGARSANMLHVVRGARAYAEGRLAAEGVGLSAPAANRLVVQLDAPVPYFLHLCAHTLLRPVPTHVLAARAARGDDEMGWARPAGLVSNGAFRLGRWRFRRDFVLHKSPTYWNAAAVRLRQVHVQIVGNADTCAQLYHAGEIDLTGPSTPVAPAYAQAWRHTRDFRAEASARTAFYWLNTTRPPLDDVRVRRALSLAIDREALVARVLRGGEQASCRLVPPALYGEALPPPSPGFDPVAARALLARATGGAPLRPLRLVYNSAEVHRQTAEAIQAMWRQHLGIEVVLDNQEWRIYLQRIGERDFDVARLGWQADFPDPEDFLANVFGAGNNLSGCTDPRWQAQIDQARLAPSPQARLRALRRTEDDILAAYLLLPLYHGTQTALVKPYVRGWRANPAGAHPFKSFALQPDPTAAAERQPANLETSW